MNEITLPVSIETEKQVLGSILLDNAVMRSESSESLTPEHFCLDSHRRIYRAMLAMAEDTVLIDFTTLAEKLQSKNELASVGSWAYITSLTDGLPRTSTVKHYVRILDDKLARRRLIHACNQAIMAACDQSEELAPLVARQQEELLRVSDLFGAETENLSVPAREFMRAAQGEVDWRVNGIIEVGTNGFFVGPPGGAKSFAALYLAACLALGCPWFNQDVKRCRVYVCSREDAASTTARRLARSLRWLDTNFEDIDQWLRFNSRQQSAQFRLDNPRHLNSLIRDLKNHRSEFLVLDVLNVMHGANENDNAEMARVLAQVKHIRDEVGCEIAVCHHSSKNPGEGKTLKELPRGAGAIGGFAEWIIHCHLVDEEQQIRQARFVTKAGSPAPSFYWRINDMPVTGEVRLERDHFYEPKGTSKTRKGVQIA